MPGMILCETTFCVKENGGNEKCGVFATCPERLAGNVPLPLRTPLQLAEAKVKAMQIEIEKLKKQKDVRDEVVAVDEKPVEIVNPKPSKIGKKK